MVEYTAEAGERANKLIESLWNDKDLGPKLRRKTKELYPDVVIPEDATDPLLEPLREQNAAMNDKLDKLAGQIADREKRDAEAKAEGDLRNSLDSARQKYRLTDDGFDKMVARMKETGNYSDAESVAAWVAGQIAPPTQPGPNWLPTRANAFGASDRDESLALLHTDPIAFEDAEMRKFAADPDAYVRESMGV